MNIINPGLESFVDHNRADFDAFEPRPGLWDAIAQDLDAAPAAPEPQAEPAPARVLPLFPQAAPAVLAGVAGPTEAATATAAVRTARPYGIAAAVATLLLLGTWAWQQPQPTRWATFRPAATAALPAEPEAEPLPYTMPELVSEASAGPEQRLASAVQRLETYYATQLAERQQELRLADEAFGADAPRADWQQELMKLDLAYQQLKTELYQNPEPEMVLEAMNRNMQIRLDVLGQQLRTREQIREYHSQPYMVADSRRLP